MHDIVIEQDVVDRYQKEIDIILGVLNHTEALVTDLSTIDDFFTAGCFSEHQDDPDVQALQKEEDAQLQELSQLFGRDVAPSETLWRLAEELRAKNHPH